MFGAEGVHHIEELERRGWEALSSPGGAAFYDDVMADDGLMVFPGLVLDKPQTLEAIAGTPPWSTFELSDVRVIEASPDLAIVVYHATARRGSEPSYAARMSSAYVRREAGWQLILHQQSPDAG